MKKMMKIRSKWIDLTKKKSPRLLFFEVSATFISFCCFCYAIATWLEECNITLTPPTISILFFSFSVNLVLLYKYLSCREYARAIIIENRKI